MFSHLIGLTDWEAPLGLVFGSLPLLSLGILGLLVVITLKGDKKRENETEKGSHKSDEITKANPVQQDEPKCIFAHGSSNTSYNAVYKKSSAAFEEFKAKQTRVILLYEDYVHLPALKAVWENPVTAYPRMEPYFVSACHGLELCFLLVAEFAKDRRHYLSKRPSIELVCRDIITQCHLLSDLLDGELEDTSTDQIGNPNKNDIDSSRKPPVTDQIGASVSPGLSHLHNVVEQVLAHSTSEERSSLCTLIKSIVSTFMGYFANGSVGLGIEYQLNELGKLAGLNGMVMREGRKYLEYSLLVRPQVVADTLFDEEYRHDEDFFFRTVHLGTECWAFIAVSRINAAKQFASQHKWNQASIQIRYAAAILNYLGDHVLMLSSMVLRDYLELKVEIQGTSGEGSLAVKSFRSLITSLMDSLAEALVGTSSQKGKMGEVEIDDDSEQDFEIGLSYVYARPDTFPGLYEFCKALETIESSLLGGFYYKHFLLANNVIGSSAKGTMNRSVAALRASFETNCFPMLDRIRAKLGTEIDLELSHNKGLIMDKIARKHSLSTSQTSSSSSTTSEKASSANSIPASPVRKGVYERCRFAERGPYSNTRGSAVVAKGGTGNSLNGLGDSDALTKPSSGSDLTGVEMTAEELAIRDRARRSLYDDSKVSHNLISAKKRLCLQQGVPTLQFLDHAYGFVPPSASEAALQEVFSEHCGLGNFAWDRLFNETMPEAATNVKSLLGLTSTSSEGGGDGKDWSVAFAHNSHELVSRLISVKLDRFLCPNSSDSAADKLVIVTSDSEFFSFTRQLNRLQEGAFSKTRIFTVSSEPLHSFTERFFGTIASTLAAEGHIDIIYTSQISYTQKTLVPNISDFVSKIRASLPELTGNAPSSFSSGPPIIMIDGYHGFGALPTNLQGVNAIYLGGILKHIGAGANLCFAAVPPFYASLRPLFTGWLADVSVLAPSSSGIVVGSDVGYTPGLNLMGSTPSFHQPMLVFNHVLRLWRSHSLTVNYAHKHVMSLQQRFIAGLTSLDGKALNNKFINSSKLVKASRAPNRLEVECEAHRSHTLVFLQSSPEEAHCIVKALREQGIGIDSRGPLVRIGFGLNHNPEDVDRLLAALRPM